MHLNINPSNLKWHLDQIIFLLNIENRHQLKSVDFNIVYPYIKWEN